LERWWENSEGRETAKKNWLENLEEDCQRVGIIYGQWTTATRFNINIFMALTSK
jgi:hypothetical protein